MIPSTKPLLPKAETLMSYLKRMDESRYYSNFGPLSTELTERLEDWIGSGVGSIAPCSSGTTALEIAIGAMDIPEGKTVILQSFTFAATAHAALNRGLKLFFADVDRQSWTLTPEMARGLMDSLSGEAKNIGLVIATSPFGQKLPVGEWEAFSRDYDMPVLLDAAAINPLDVQPSDIVTSTISLHATKMLNAGEGGLVVRQNPDYIAHTRDISNFGLLHPGGIQRRSVNAKMSEYHAAVALASLDEWDRIWDDFMRVAQRYRSHLGAAKNIKLRPGYGDERPDAWCSASTIIETKDVLDHEAIQALGIGSRAAWRYGCHKEPVFADFPKADLSITDEITSRYAAVPCFRDLRDDQIDFVCEQLLSYVGEKS